MHAADEPNVEVRKDFLQGGKCFRGPHAPVSASLATYQIPIVQEIVGVPSRKVHCGWGRPHIM